MNTKPFISVLMPVYNCENYIREAVESILNQTYTNFEFIIIDDASTDQTVAIIQSYKDERIHLIVKPKNSGYTNSLNYGLTITKGKYIARMDGDDISLPNRFQKQIEILEHNDNIIVCGSVYKIIGTEKIIKNPETNEAIKMALLKGSAIGHPTTMFRKSVLEENNLQYDITMQPAEDYALWVKLLRYGELYNIQEPLLLYREHANQVSKTKKVKQSYKVGLSKFNLLTYLEFPYTEQEKNVYVKLSTLKERLSLNELEIFRKLKTKLLAYNTHNSNSFFHEEGFRTFLNDLETKTINEAPIQH